MTSNNPDSKAPERAPDIIGVGINESCAGSDPLRMYCFELEDEGFLDAGEGERKYIAEDSITPQQAAKVLLEYFNNKERAFTASQASAMVDALPHSSALSHVVSALKALAESKE